MFLLSYSKELIYCPLCRKKLGNFKLWIKTDVGDIIRCNQCGLGFLNPNKESNIKNINTTLYNSKFYYKLLSRSQQELSRRYNNQMKEISRLVKKKGNIIDIGCSIGMFLKTAATFGFNPYGYDINKINLNKAKKLFGINILPDNYLENKKFNNFFDVATIWDVLEHIHDPVEFLSQLIGKIKPGGLLVVQCPNMESYDFLKFGNKWDWLIPGDHIQFFTQKTLVKVLIESGFYPIKVKNWIDGLTFSKSMFSLHSRNPILIFNRIQYKALNKIKNLCQSRKIYLPIERIQCIFGWILQMMYHAKHKNSLIIVFALKP